MFPDMSLKKSPTCMLSTKFAKSFLLNDCSVEQNSFLFLSMSLNLSCRLINQTHLNIKKRKVLIFNLYTERTFNY